MVHAKCLFNMNCAGAVTTIQPIESAASIDIMQSILAMRSIKKSPGSRKSLSKKAKQPTMIV